MIAKIRWFLVIQIVQRWKATIFTSKRWIESTKGPPRNHLLVTSGDSWSRSLACPPSGCCLKDHKSKICFSSFERKPPKLSQQFSWAEEKEREIKCEMIFKQNQNEKQISQKTKLPPRHSNHRRSQNGHPWHHNIVIIKLMKTVQKAQAHQRVPWKDTVLSDQWDTWLSLKASLHSTCFTLSRSDGWACESSSCAARVTLVPHSVDGRHRKKLTTVSPHWN